VPIWKLTLILVPADGVLVTVGVRVGVGVRVDTAGVLVRVAVLVGVQVGACVGAGSEADILLLPSLLSTTTFVESAVAVDVPMMAGKLIVMDCPAARPATVCVYDGPKATTNDPALALPLLLTTTLSRGWLAQGGFEPT